MRPIWKGSVVFGLVNVPIRVFSATEDHDIHLHQVHDKDGGRIHYQRRCDACGKAVNYKHIQKAYDDGEETVVLPQDDLDGLPSNKSNEIEVLEFVPTDQLDMLAIDRSYYLGPDSKTPKAYVLLQHVLTDSKRTAIVKVTLRQKTRLGALRVRDKTLILQTLLWADEVRGPDFPELDGNIRLSAKERDMAQDLVESYASDFKPENYTDDYQKELRKLIDAKLEEGESVDTEDTFGETESGGEVIDLMDALQKSVKKNRAGGSKSRTSASKASKKSSSKKSSSKGSSSTKSSSKASSSKKTPSKKTGKKAS
ncbi:non-homologous end joining protein Ku [Spelaeicoccus albus]|uniref:non-homologous end joining protein Ku n=1 Tax=Spelaeicoccus albus TaxID=1280376 RepID=UPI0015C8A16F